MWESKCFINSYDHRFCIDCWIKNIQTKINSDWRQVHCMERGCNTKITIEDIIKYDLIPSVEVRTMCTERLTIKTIEETKSVCRHVKRETQNQPISIWFVVQNVNILFVGNVMNNGMEERVVGDGDNF